MLIDIYKKDIDYSTKCRTILKIKNKIVEILIKLKNQNLPSSRFENLFMSKKD